MKSASKAFLIIATSLAAATASRAQAENKLTADEILKKSIRDVYTQSEESTYVMRLADGDGKETHRKMRVWFKRDGENKAKLLIKFLEPADIRNTGLLSIVEQDRPADQWIYLPAVKKVRRVKGGNENESFLGSDFTVGDLTSMDDDGKRYQYAITAPSSKCGEADCYVITGNPKSGVDASALPYSKKVLHVRKDNFVTSKIEFFNAEGMLEKILELKGLQNVSGGDGKHWLANRMEMKNLLNPHSTVIEIQKRDAKAPADSVFTQSYLERN